MVKLPVLLDRVAETSARVMGERPQWPCRRGCDDCCRALAEPMRLSRAEWELLRPVLDGLESSTREAIAARLGDTRTCAMLDRHSGACLVYEGRPIACRAYGFHVGRDGGRWCSILEKLPELTSAVMLGNHDLLERDLDALGDTRTLSEWFRLL
jgi:uncharacterized protein